MPNWVKNKVKFDSKEVIKDCYSNENGEEYFDFDKIIPMPKSLHLTSGGSEDISIIYAISKMKEDKKQEIINKLKNISVSFYGNYYKKIFTFEDRYSEEDFIKHDRDLKDIICGKKKSFEDIDYTGLGIKNLEDLGNTYINNIIEYGFDTWYDWSCKNWGTKWGACHTYYVDENNIEFDTAWSTPYNIFKEISKKYKTRVEVEYADENIGNNCGTLIFDNGELLEQNYGDNDFAYKVWNYSEEEIKELEMEE